jgi:hypothetical protein
MRMRRALLIGLCALAAAGACTSEVANGPAEPDDPNGDTRTDAAPPVTALPSMCEGVGEVPDEAEITFAKGELLFGVSPEGDGIRCITAVAGVNPIFWGPQGDVVIDVGFSASEVVSESERTIISGPGKSPRYNGFSRPNGTSTLFTALDGTRLAKVPVDGSKLTDISFLRRHDEAAFHPGGTQIAVTGETEDDDVYGVWLATNDGEDSHLVVPHRDEDEFYGVTFSSDGATLYYVDDQHSSFELRAVNLSELEVGLVVPKSRLVVKKRLPMSVMTSPFTPDLLTYRLGTCDDGFETVVLEGDASRRVGRRLGDTQPIGWLPDDRLVLASTKDLCDRERLLDLHVVDGENLDLLVEDVTYAAVRAVVPIGPAPVSGPTGSSPD